jgi:hypothetical protein
MVFTLLMLAAGTLAGDGSDGDRPRSVAEVAAQIDALMERHWASAGVNPTDLASDSTFLRRITLDLLGRIPTEREAVEFAHDASPDKRVQCVERLMSSPEYALHFGNVLDELIQGKYAGDRNFITYLRQSIAQHKTWDRLFQEIMLGPWDTDEQKPAARFLSQRIRDLDDLTTDTSRVFFGIEIACAKCHDHPLVPDWTQHHYYGMASFFNRTYEFGKERIVAEKDTDDVTFVDRAGTQSTARIMFLSGKVIDEPKMVIDPKLQDLKERRKKEGRYLEPAFSRREQLVRVALDDKAFFSKAIVNQIWATLFGRGLVHPTDQMHSENLPSVDGPLELLAADFSNSGYDLDRLVSAMVSTRTYQRSSMWHSASEPPGAEQFAVAQLRSLTPRQYAFAVILATGDQALDRATPENRSDRYRDIENRAASLTESMDRRSTNQQSSTNEALFMSNSPALQQLVQPAGENLVARLAAMPDTDHVVETAIWTTLGRAPDPNEKSHLVTWLESNAQARSVACCELVWALLTSAEFRFNH